MIAWLMKLLPADYKWSVASKSVGYDIGKMIAGVLSWSAASSLEQKMHITITPETQNAIAQGVGVVVTGALAWLHDYLKLKYPNATWL